MQKEKINKDSLLSKWKNHKKKGIDKAMLSKAPENVVNSLSLGQKRLWFLQRLYPNNPFYNYAETYTLEGKLNLEHLKKSLELVIEEQAILRSYYPIKEGEILFNVLDTVEVDIVTFDFSALPEKEKQHRIHEIMLKDATTSFNMAKAPLWCMSLIKLGPETHYLLVTLHHIITDKWSMGIFRDRMAKHYANLSQGNNSTAETPELQYSDYTHAQQGNVIDPVQMKYWKDKLSDDIPVLDLATDLPRPNYLSYKGALEIQEFSKEFSKAIFDLCKKMEVTPYVLMLSVYYTLLYRYTGQKDIAIGTPISSRDQSVLEKIIGFFNDTAVLRTILDDSKSFAELLVKVRETTLGAFSNKDIPFDELVRQLKPQRSLTTNPFFQVMFLYHTVPETPSFGTDLQLVRQSPFDMEVCKFDLTLYVSDNNGVLSTTMEYATDLFEKPTIQRLQEHLRLLLEGIVENPHRPISEIPMQTPQEKELFFEEHNTTDQPYTSHTGIHHIIEKTALENANLPAITYDNVSMTYGELNYKAERLARLLLSKKENEIIGLCIDRSLEMIVGLLAILKAGCAYLPIDPEYPAQRINFMLEDADVKLILTNENLTSLFSETAVTRVLIDDKELDSIVSTAPLPTVNRDNLAYIIYTSGSTGKPKGVPITHGNIITSTEGRLQFYKNNPTAFLLMSSIAFDSSKAGVFWTLCTGGNLVISEKRLEQDIEKIGAIISENNISHTLMLPSLYKLLLEHLEVEKLQSLTTVMVAGEACSSTLCKLHFNTFPTVDLYNEYGPTEATVWCIAHHITEEDIHTTIPIGKAVAGAKVYLLDSNLKLVPRGSVGEIYIGGPGLSGQYLNRPDLTEKAYIPNPFKEDKRSNLYKTGDIGRYGNHGNIEFLGRADQQVKIRGFRIELDEIENVFYQNPMIKEAVITIGTEETSILDRYTNPTPQQLAEIMEASLTEEESTELIASVASLNEEEYSFLLNQMDVEPSH